ncbi:MAG: hypothetical protein E7005_04985 [Alphaproteobacteria bacterium]|nr:hypothetical protein [Alphaproteobacteria bacterium]
MKQFILKLSAILLFMLISIVSKADSFFLPIKSDVCINNNNNEEKQDLIFKLNDKAALLAVKSSDYVKNKALSYNDYEYSLIAYKIVDNALNDTSYEITKENEKKICLSFNASLDKQKTDRLFENFKKSNIDKTKIKEIANNINQTLPKSIYENNIRTPLIYIDDLEFYNNTKTPKYKDYIKEQLIFEPSILITEKKDLADFYLNPKVVKSSIDKIDEKNSKFSMAVELKINNSENKEVLKETKKRYIIIDNSLKNQEIAHKMLTKLLNEALASLKDKINLLKVL